MTTDSNGTATTGVNGIARNEGAAKKMVAHHSAMVTALQDRVRMLEDAAQGGLPHETAAKAVASYMAGEIVPHAEGEEQTIYAVARDKPELRVLIQAMVAEHKRLRRCLTGLVAANDAVASYGVARALVELFEAHAEKENEQLLPALVADVNVNMAALLDEMHEKTAHAHDHADLSEGGAMEEMSDVDLDVRALPHAQRHQMIFSLLDRLQPGQALVIVNDHDPQPLRYQMNAIWPGRYEWEYQASGPVEWRVAVRKAKGE